MFFETPLTQYGIAPSPPPGSQLQKIEIKDESYNEAINHMKDRYVWYPFSDIDFTGKMFTQPMSFIRLYRGRVGWVQAVSYRALDNSADAFDQIGEDELPLKSFVCTPYAQASYLDANYANRGMVSLHHLIGKPPELVAMIEQIVLPEVGLDLVELGTYLSTQSPVNIEAANLDPKTKALAEQTMVLMIDGVNAALKYCRELIAESEAEILTRKNKGWGKAHLDGADRYAFLLTRRELPPENTLDNSPERKQTALLEKMVEALSGVKGNDNLTANNIEERVAEAEKKYAALQDKFVTLMDKYEALMNAPKAEPEKDLAKKLNDAKNNQRR